MIVVGIDAHKNTHTLVAVDQVGKRIGVLTVEDCRHLTRRLEIDLLISGHQVVRVHTRLMAGMRRGGRERGKSDPIDADAEAVARVALREDNLPTAVLAGPTRDIKLYSDHRRNLVEYRTGLQAKLRWFLHEIDPELEA
ncbi:transposase [Leifsonia rubra CMS 76R]|nr:transposase [Leifsonia rubra CMS 76R]